MNIKEPLIILLVLFVLVGLAFSPIKEANLGKKSSTGSPSSIGSASQNLSTSPNKDVAEDVKDAEAELKELQENLNKKIDESKRSPYYNKIRMSSISGLHQNDPSREFLSLSTSLKNNEVVKITGWYLKSEVTGYFAVIGKAALLPFPFTKTESDVVLAHGDRAYITKGFSPIGISFRTNKCTGYFEENRTFVPSLSLECPRPKDEKLPTFSNVYDRNDECLAVIDKIPRCGTRDNEYFRDLPDTVPSSCKTYVMAQVNYNTCVALHFSDTDFPGDEYRIYLNKFGPLWRQKHDKINLHDENGLVVDSISY